MATTEKGGWATQPPKTEKMGWGELTAIIGRGDASVHISFLLRSTALRQPQHLLRLAGLLWVGRASAPARTRRRLLDGVG